MILNFFLYHNSVAEHLIHKNIITGAVNGCNRMLEKYNFYSLFHLSFSASFFLLCDPLFFTYIFLFQKCHNQNNKVRNILFPRLDRLNIDIFVSNKKNYSNKIHSIWKQNTSLTKISHYINYLSDTS